MKKFLGLFLILSVLWSEEKVKTDSLETVAGFYATGINTENFFLSRHLSPKVQPQDKTNLLFSFFTTSCMPCRSEIPFLQKYASHYDIEKLYLINIGDKKETVHRYLKEYNIHTKVLHDPYGVISKRLNIESTPVMLIVSGDGELLYRHDGFKASDTLNILRALENNFNKGEK
jgi:thiol-disulfide isomerase/thioredoxin